jgi:hypothetical protein
MFYVVCPDYTSRSLTREGAERKLAAIEKVGWCRNPHDILDEEQHAELLKFKAEVEV